MGSLCLSATTILRCESFTRIQNQTLLIPTAIELLATTSLIYTNRHRGRRHLLLTLEGWTYSALALLEMLSHILPAAREDANTFKILDNILAAFSFIPMLLFMTFLYILTRSETIPLLPRRLQRLLQLLLLISVPAIIALNIISTYIGISQRVILVHSTPVLSIGFATTKDSTLWSFFASITLALYAAYQAITWSLLFYRLLRALLGQRRIENASQDSAHLIRGTGWINAGVKLGAVETVIGFVLRGGFGMALVRRIGRAISRALICIGIAKGMDYLEDFQQAREEMTPRRLQLSSPRPFSQVSISHIRQLILNPRPSTIRQNSPIAVQLSPSSRSKGYNVTDEKWDLYAANYGTYGRSPQSRSMARVTVVPKSARDSTPTLHMRFSDLGLPSPAAIAEHVKSGLRHSYGRRYSAVDGESSKEVPVDSDQQAQKRRKTIGGTSDSVGDGEWTSAEGLGQRKSIFGVNVPNVALPAPALIGEYTFSPRTRFQSLHNDNEKQTKDQSKEPKKLRKKLWGSSLQVPPSFQPKPIQRIKTNESKTAESSLDRSDSQRSRQTTLSRSLSKRKPLPPLLPPTLIDDDVGKSSPITGPEIVFASAVSLGRGVTGAPAGPRPPVPSVWNPNVVPSPSITKSDPRSIDPFSSDDDEEDGDDSEEGYSYPNKNIIFGHNSERHLSADVDVASLPPSRASSPTYSPKLESFGGDNKSLKVRRADAQDYRKGTQGASPVFDRDSESLSRPTFGQQDDLELGMEGEAPHESYLSTDTHVITREVVSTPSSSNPSVGEMGTAVVVRVESIRHAPRRKTPFPVRPLPGPIRGSVYVQPVVVSDKAKDSPVSQEPDDEDDDDAGFEMVRWKGKGKEVRDAMDLA